MPVELERFLEMARALPEVEEGSHRGHPDLRVRGKIFVGLARPDAPALKTTPEDLAELLDSDPETFRNAWGRRWVGVDLERVEPETLQVLLERAWHLTAPKSLRER